MSAIFGSSGGDGVSFPPSLQKFYESMGDMPDPGRRPSYEGMDEPGPSLPPMGEEDGAMWLQDQMPDTDPVAHERDLLYVVNYAMENGKVRTISDFASWIQMQLAYAQREGQWTNDSRHKQAPPDILQLSKYLQRQSLARRY